MGQLDQWWLWRGAQSAIFYYVSCGPCYSAAYQRKRRKQALKDKKEKEQLQTEQPGMYHHPAPFEINPHWQEEITLGPGPPPRRNRNRTRDSKDTAPRNISTAGTQSTLGSLASSSTDLGPQQNPSHALGSQSWHKKKYGRPDEEFVNEADEDEHDDQLFGPSKKSASGWSIGKPEAAYGAARAPPINDLHPPVVSTPPSQWKDRRWMMAPPPSAKFMQGKKGVTNVSRSASRLDEQRNASSQEVALMPSPMLHPAMDDKPKGHSLEVPDAHSVISRASSARYSSRGERSDSFTTPTKNAAERRMRGSRKARPPPVRVDGSSSDDSDFTDYDIPIAKPKPVRQKNSVRAKRAPAVQPVAAARIEREDKNTIEPGSPTLSARSVETASPVGSPNIRALSSLTNTSTNTTAITRPGASPPIGPDLAVKTTRGAVKMPLPENDSKEVLALDDDVNIEELWLGERNWDGSQIKRWSTEF